MRNDRAFLFTELLLTTGGYNAIILMKMLLIRFNSRINGKAEI